MDNSLSNSQKKIPLNEITPGMYVVALDRSWMSTPFIFHRRLITSAADVELLQKHGVREVVIDTARGADVCHPDRRPEVSIREVASSGAVPHSPPVSAAEIAFRPLAAEIPAAQAIHEEALEVAQSIFDGATEGTPVDGKIAKKVVRDLAASIDRSAEANLLLVQMRRFQKDLFSHAVNVCVLTLVVNAIESFEDDVLSLGFGALLHDIGETRIPANLTRKGDGCSDAERRLVEQHPALGAKLLEHIKDIPSLARRIILEHHERIDGSGSPFGKRRLDIALPSQIVAIIDSYDEMLMGRNQQAAAPTEVLRQLFLLSRDGALDHDLIERIIRGLGVYPIGSVVELSTGERAIVVAANRSDRLKPVVRIISSRTGAAQPNGPIVSLAESTERRRIVNALDPVKERINPMVFLRVVPITAGGSHG